jgi:hypothetical protein
MKQIICQHVLVESTRHCEGQTVNAVWVSSSSWVWESYVMYGQSAEFWYGKQVVLRRLNDEAASVSTLKWKSVNGCNGARTLFKQMKLVPQARAWLVLFSCAWDSVSTSLTSSLTGKGDLYGTVRNCMQVSAVSCFLLAVFAAQCRSIYQTNKQTPWSESVTELYRPSARPLSAKWSPTCADRGCHVVSVTDPYGRILGFLDRSRYFSIKQLQSCTHEAEWTPFQTHYSFFFLVVPGTEPGPPDL